MALESCSGRPLTRYYVGMTSSPSLVFYDGHCGLCHWAVRFLLKRDTDGTRFRFAPLQGETLRQELSDDRIAQLSDSIVVLTSDHEVLQESKAVLVVLQKIGGVWRMLGRFASWIPRSFRDFAYRGVARMRHRLFASQPDLCPVVPESIRGRFLP